MIRNRKGHLPHIVVVTGEPLPSRLASLALGTGDIDCMYHFALYELVKAVEATGAEDSIEMLNVLIDGKRIKDIRNRKRPIQVKFFVDERELGLIKARMAQLGIENMSAYLRQVAIDGYKKKADLPEHREPKNP